MDYIKLEEMEMKLLIRKITVDDLDDLYALPSDGEVMRLLYL